MEDCIISNDSDDEIKCDSSVYVFTPSDLLALTLLKKIGKYNSYLKKLPLILYHNDCSESSCTKENDADQPKEPTCKKR